MIGVYKNPAGGPPELNGLYNEFLKGKLGITGRLSDMKREFLKAKIHRATVTESNLHYSGSVSIAEDIMEKAGIAHNERIHVFNINTGVRFDTYAIRGERESRSIGLNGAAARLGEIGDLIIIVTYCYLTDDEIPHHKSRTLLMREGNQIEEIIES